MLKASQLQRQLKMKTPKRCREKLEVQNACKPVKLPEAEQVDIDSPITLPPIPSGYWRGG